MNYMNYKNLCFITLIGLISIMLASPAHASEPDWIPMNIGTERFFGIWGSSYNDIFVVGEDPASQKGAIIVHYDGHQWTEMESGTTNTLQDVWGSSSQDVFIVGDNGTILHYDGHQWSQMDSGVDALYDLYGVWGTASDNVFVVGGYGYYDHEDDIEYDEGIILHYDGVSWTVVERDFPGLAFDVWGTSENDVYVVGWPGLIFHYDGHKLKQMESGTDAFLLNVWGSSSQDVFAVGTIGWGQGVILHYDGVAWKETKVGTQNTSIWGTSANDVFVAGSDGNTSYILHYDGSQWLLSWDEELGNRIWDMWGIDNDVFAVGYYGTILHYKRDDEPLDWETMGGTAGYGINDVWGVSERNLFAVGAQMNADWTEATGSIFQYDGRGWIEQYRDPGVSITGVWGSSEQDIFAVGIKDIDYYNAPRKGKILHYDGQSWTVMEDGNIPGLLTIWGNNKNNIYAAGVDGTILHYDGTSWQTMDSPTTVWLNHLWGDADDNIFVVGDTGTILYYDGHQWVSMDSGITQNLWGVWGSSDNNIFVVGDAGMILHYDGHHWSMMDSPTTELLSNVWGSSANNIITVGDNGIIMQYDGTNWTKMKTGVLLNLYNIWGNSEDDIFVVGDTILHHGTPLSDLKLASNVIPAPGELVTYVATFENVRSATATGIVLTATVPTELTNVTYQASGVKVTPITGSRYVWQVDDMAMGKTGRITITGHLPSNIPVGSSITNTFTIATDSREVAAENNHSSEVITVAPEINLRQDEEQISYSWSGWLYNFGFVSVGSSKTVTFTLENIGRADLSLTNIVLTGTNPSDFVLDTTELITTLKVGQSTRFQMTFTPLAEGFRGAVLHIISNDGDENPYIVGLYGRRERGIYLPVVVR
jgi:uncharacterized repeat protein (TIGR01451 family)